MKSRRQQAPQRKVIIVISLRCASARDVLMGVFHQIEASSEWAVNLLQPEDNPMTVEKLRAAESEGAAAVIITRQCSDEIMQELARTTLPVVSVGIRSKHLDSRQELTIFVHNDNAAIGDMGARHFFNRGRFNSYGFVLKSAENEWGMERADAFRARVAELAPDAEIGIFSQPTPIDHKSEIAVLAKWIASLPKPAAVMADCDSRAIDVLAACEQAHISVPDSVAVLGVDNDEFVCAHASTPLSSVLPGHIEMGRVAAETLYRMLKRKSRPKRGNVVTVPPIRVVERESTHLRSPSAILVDRIKRFIHEHAAEGIKVQDIAARLHVSRRLAEIRWREATGGTIRSAIEDVRMAKLKKLLLSTHMSISSIATECGYRDPDVLAHIFRRRFGMSMREWRTRKDPHIV